MKPLLPLFTNLYAKKILLSLLTSIVFLFPSLSNAQTLPDLGIASSFAFYTSAGMINNEGATTIAGDVGTAVGPINGLTYANGGGPGYVTGTIYTETDVYADNVAPVVCSTYDDLAGRTCGTTLASGVLDNLTINPGVTCTGGAASLSANSTLTLNAGANPDAVFIIQIGGLFQMGTGAKVILLGAKIENVFFQVNGEFIMGADALFTGTVITKGGAISLGANAKLFGRALACSGAINLNTNTALSVQAAVLPIILTEFTAAKQNNKTLITWTTESEVNTKYFIVEHSKTGQPNTWTSKGKINASGYSTTVKHYSFTDNNPSLKDNYYRLKSVDNDNSYTLSQSKYVSFSNISASLINAFPVPFNDVINLTGVEKGSSIILSDLSGKTIRYQTATGTGNEKISASNLSPGSYFIKIISADGKTTSVKINKQ